MKFMSTIRVVATLCVGATSIAANAQLQLACPQDWYALSDIDGPNADKVILGVKARDWKKEYLDQMLSKEDECSRIGADPDSIKRANLNEVQKRMYPNAIMSLEARDRRQQQEATRVQQAAEEDKRRIQYQAQQQQESKVVEQRERDKARSKEGAFAQQVSPDRQMVAAQQEAEREKSRNLLIVLGLIAASVGGWGWNKFIRNRCPNCKSTSCERTNVEETNRWVGSKQVTEKHSRGTNTRHVRATYVTNLYEYRCKACQNTWTKERKEELGEASALGRFFSGY